MERFTIQRKLILDAVSELGHARIKDISKYLEAKSYNVSLATIYRNVDSLVNDDLLKKVTLNLKEDYYEIKNEVASHTHDKYNFICEKCGKIIDVAPKFNDQKEYVDDLGNLVTSIAVTYYGICKDCKQKSK